MRDRSDRYQVSAAQPISQPKRLGGYLIEAGLITPDQVSVALNDQQSTGMRFGEVLVARGWLKEQTVEWIMQKVIVPEKKAHQRHASNQSHASNQTISQDQTVRQPLKQSASNGDRPPVQTVPSSRFDRFQSAPTTNSFSRREAPISKPLPPVKTLDEDVNWVG